MYRFLTILIVTIAIAMMLLAVAGGVLHYSPIPLWDMLNGTLAFVMNFNDGNHAALWAQHNESRLVLSRLLFLLDGNLFGGIGIALIVANYLLVFFATLVFWRILLSVNRGKIPVPVTNVAAICLGAWLLLWTQENNFTWGFQGRYFLAQLLPLLAFVALARSQQSETRRAVWFGFSCLLGIASVGTMANGLMALPLLALAAIALGTSARGIAVLCVLSAGAFWLYLLDYAHPMGLNSMSGSWLSRPLESLLFAFLYLGSPFYLPTGGGTRGEIIAGLAGFVLVVLTLLAANMLSRQRVENALRIALVFFVFYVFGSALATAGWRVGFGVASAVASPFTTPAIMAWAALFCVYGPRILRNFTDANPEKTAFLILANTAAIGLLAFQFKALSFDEDALDGQQLGVLAMELGIEDPDTIANVFPDAASAVAIGQRASERNVSIFGLPPFRDLSLEIGRHVDTSGAEACAGSIDRIDVLEGSDAFVRVEGWQFNETSNSAPDLVRLINDDGQVVGLAFAGTLRPDLASAVGPEAEKAGFTGYVLATSVGERTHVFGASANCIMTGGL